jgi:hypothetical protein
VRICSPCSWKRCDNNTINSSTSCTMILLWASYYSQHLLLFIAYN